VIAYAGGEIKDEISAAQVAEVLGVADRRVLFALSEAILNHDAATALGVVDDLFRDGHDLSQVAQAFTTHLRDLIVVASCADSAPLVDATEAELNDLRKQADQVDLSLLQQHFDRFAHAAEEIARSTFPRLLFEMALIELVNAEPLLPLGDLLARLETLERKLSKTPAGGSPDDNGPKGKRSNPRRAPLTFQAPSSRGGQRGAPATATSDLRTAHAEQTTAHTEQKEAREHTERSTTPKNIPTPPTDPDTASSPTPPIKAEAASSDDTRSPQSPKRTDRKPTARDEPIAQDKPSTSDASPQGNTSTQSILADDATLTRWRELLDKVGAPLSTTFAVGRLISWQDGKVELGYAPDAFELTWAQDPKRRASFVERCGEFFETPLRLEIRSLTEEEQRSPEFRRLSVIEAREEEERQRVSKLREEAESHPVARSLVENFGAKILAVNIEDDVLDPQKQEQRIGP
ncbi:MAG: hypothetical protein KAI47_24395, partial [Deltaproteobacteria bacterium]|nr:hypothetical protein [Deltaproteobacteria bacterium]